MKSPIVKRSILLNGRKTSISMEDIFWNALKHIASESQAPVSHIIQDVNNSRRTSNLSSSLRSFVLAYYVNRCGFKDILPEGYAEVVIGSGKSDVAKASSPAVADRATEFNQTLKFASGTR